MRHLGFLAIPARLPSMRSGTRRCKSLGHDLPLFRLKRRQKSDAGAGDAGRTRAIEGVQSTHYERRGECGADVVEPILANASNFQHISILQGTKVYGVHLHPIPIPARERDPRDPHDNFFLDQEDYVREMGAKHGFSYTALRPQLVTSPTPGALNVLPAIGVYAAIRREKGEPPARPARAGSECCNSRPRHRRAGCTPPPSMRASPARAATSGRPGTGPSTSVVAEGGTSWRAARTTPRVAPLAHTGTPTPRTAS
jgi:hypothetical protein